jgi:hypothetical protein
MDSTRRKPASGGEDVEALPGAVGHNYPEDRQLAPRAEKPIPLCHIAHRRGLWPVDKTRKWPWGDSAGSRPSASVSGHGLYSHAGNLRPGPVKDTYGAILVCPAVSFFGQLTRQSSGVYRRIADRWETLPRVVLEGQVQTPDREVVSLHNLSTTR